MATSDPGELDDVETITLPGGVCFPVELLTRGGESRHGRGELFAPHPRLPDLAPALDHLFLQISRAD